MTLRKRLLLIALSATFAVTLGSMPATSQLAAPPVQSCSNPGSQLSLFAEPLGHGRIGYGRTSTTATIPGPTLIMTEGDCLAVNLVNDTHGRVGLHVHGVSYTPASDGTRFNHSCVRPGASRTYIWHALTPSADPSGTVTPGSAGYWPYHDHCRGTPHGTGGIDAGLFGALIVRAPGDPTPDVPPFVIVMGPGATINLKDAPQTPIFKANMGQRVEFVVIGMGDLFHTFHLHGHRWADNRTGIPSSATDPVAIIDNKTVGPADSFGFQVVAGYDVGPGAWMYHCHVQSHSDAGMSGLFLVRRADGTETKQEKRAVARWKEEETYHSKHMPH